MTSPWSIHLYRFVLSIIAFFQHLIPPFQVVLGACRLVPTPKYYPLRFHCAKILREISASTATFIPILPIYLEVLNNFNFGKKSRKATKPEKKVRYR